MLQRHEKLLRQNSTCMQWRRYASNNREYLNRNYIYKCNSVIVTQPCHFYDLAMQHM
jgi:hypothetical protein